MSFFLPSFGFIRGILPDEVVKLAKLTKAKRSAAAKKAWRTRKRKYGKDGVKG